MSSADDDTAADHQGKQKIRVRRRRRRARREGSDDEHEDDSAFMAAMEEKMEKLSVLDSEDEEELAADIAEPQAEALEKQGFWFRKKKGVTGKLATSRLGTALFKKYMDEETVELIDANKRIVASHKDEKFSKDLHKHIMRLSVKAIMLYDNHTFTEEDFAQFRVPFRKICNLIKNNYARNIWDDHLISRLSDLVKSIAEGLKAMLNKYVKAETLSKLDECAQYLESKAYWEHAHQSDDYKVIVEVFSHYLDEFD
eukprot:TRINITY_DN784_c0_g1_i2.p1 TRINITY_DN784_c0_g1~~TRINITY_DN784_c0_g1_i2.p1  ORF type:complete len:255 (-),score=96.52 TRINITY_DN784_c0_g1_i2:113-877(-)